MTFILVRIILLVLLVTEERITFNTITSICIGLADEDSCIINNNTNTCCLGRLLLSCKLGAHLFADCIMDSEFDKDGVSNWGREFEKQVRFPLWYLRTRNWSVIKSPIKPLPKVPPPTFIHPYPPNTMLQIPVWENLLDFLKLNSVFLMFNICDSNLKSSRGFISRFVFWHQLDTHSYIHAISFFCTCISPFYPANGTSRGYGGFHFDKNQIQKHPQIAMREKHTQ